MGDKYTKITLCDDTEFKFFHRYGTMNLASLRTGCAMCTVWVDKYTESTLYDDTKLTSSLAWNVEHLVCVGSWKIVFRIQSP